MAWIEGPAVDPDIIPKTVQLDLPLRAIVTGQAKGLELPTPELVNVTVVRLDVICDRGRHDDAALQAEFTQGVLTKLRLAYPLPARRAVQVIELHDITR